MFLILQYRNVGENLHKHEASTRPTVLLSPKNVGGNLGYNL